MYICSFCGKVFDFNETVPKVHGLFVRISCPRCGHETEDKLLNFLDHACGCPRASLKGAATMEKRAQLLEVNSAEYLKSKGKPGKEKKKPKKEDKKDKKGKK